MRAPKLYCGICGIKLPIWNGISIHDCLVTLLFVGFFFNFSSSTADQLTETFICYFVKGICSGHRNCQLICKIFLESSLGSTQELPSTKMNSRKTANGLHCNENIWVCWYICTTESISAPLPPPPPPPPPHTHPSVFSDLCTANPTPLVRVHPKETILYCQIKLAVKREVHLDSLCMLTG